MSTIIKKQYETAKELLKSADYHLYYYENIDRSDKNFDKFFNTVTSLLTIVGGVQVGYSRVLQEDRDNGLNIVDNYRQKFAAYEAELMQAGLIGQTWEEILADVEPTEPAEQIEYTEEQKAQMWYEHQKQMDYDPQF